MVKLSITIMIVLAVIWFYGAFFASKDETIIDEIIKLIHNWCGKMAMVMIPICIGLALIEREIAIIISNLQTLGF